MHEGARISGSNPAGTQVHRLEGLAARPLAMENTDSKQGDDQE